MTDRTPDEWGSYTRYVDEHGSAQERTNNPRYILVELIDERQPVHSIDLNAVRRLFGEDAKDVHAAHTDGFGRIIRTNPVDPPSPKTNRRMPPWYNVEDRVCYDGEGEGGDVPGTVIAKKEGDNGDEEYRVRWDDDNEMVDEFGDGPRWFSPNELRPA